MYKHNAITVDLLLFGDTVPLVPNPANLVPGDVGFDSSVHLLVGQRAYNVDNDTCYRRTKTGIVFDRFITQVERDKLLGVADNANNYIHPESHSAIMISETTEKQFVSQTVKEKIYSSATISIIDWVEGQPMPVVDDVVSGEFLEGFSHLVVSSADGAIINVKNRVSPDLKIKGCIYFKQYGGKFYGVTSVGSVMVFDDYFSDGSVWVSGLGVPSTMDIRGDYLYLVSEGAYICYSLADKSIAFQGVGWVKTMFNGLSFDASNRLLIADYDSVEGKPTFLKMINPDGSVYTGFSSDFSLSGGLYVREWVVTPVWIYVSYAGHLYRMSLSGVLDSSWSKNTNGYFYLCEDSFILNDLGRLFVYSFDGDIVHSTPVDGIVNGIAITRLCGLDSKGLYVKGNNPIDAADTFLFRLGFDLSFDATFPVISVLNANHHDAFISESKVLLVSINDLVSRLFYQDGSEYFSGADCGSHVLNLIRALSNIDVSTFNVSAAIREEILRLRNL